MHPAKLIAIPLLLLFTPGCEGPAGPAGTTGPAGKAGAAGADGQDGQDGQDGINTLTPSYVLSTACGKCHATKYASWKKTGHGNALTEVDGAKPADPPFSTWPATPPTDDKGKSYGWKDVTYIVGGLGWQAVFADAKGYLISGAKAAHLVDSDTWGPFEQGKAPGTIKLTCPECHSTGWLSIEDHEVSKKQDDLEGAGGNWVEEGVTCERCHGPGGLHEPGSYNKMTIDRTSAMCGKCHGVAPLKTIAADSGLIARGQQYNEISATKMKIVNCVDCHDPHVSVRVQGDSSNPYPSIVTGCELCHYKKVTKQKVGKHLTDSNGPDCVTCHMPKAVKSAEANPSYWTGDLRSHLFRINTDPTAPAVSSDGKRFMPYLTINFACRQCHADKAAKSDALLKSNAVGYHD